MSDADGGRERSAFGLKVAAANLVFLPGLGLPLLAVAFIATGICGGVCNQVPRLWAALGVVAAVLAALFVWTLAAVRRRRVSAGLAVILCILDVPALLLLLLFVRHLGMMI